MAPLKTPAEKLPLTTRKNLRDEWEAKKPEYEETMQEILGTAWTIELNPNLIYQYARDDYKARIGSVIVWYMDAFVYNLKRFADGFGADGVQELNTICSKHQLVFAPQEKTKFSYGGFVIEDEVLRLVFAEDCLGTNVDDVTRDFATALKNAPPPAGGSAPFNLVARNAVKEDYEPKIEELLESVRTLVNMTNLKLNPNFEANAAELSKSQTHVEQGWDKRIGSVSLAYFEGLRYFLDRQNFKGDDMQQEAFQEAVDKGEVILQLLPKWEDKQHRYNRVKIDGGILYMQATLEYWGVNVDDCPSKLLDIL